MVTSFWSHLLDRVSLSDVAAAMLCLFVSNAAIHRLTTKGPMNWPVLGIIPTFLPHLSRPYDWATDALARAGGTFSFRGMWFGNYSGVLTADPSNVEYMLKTRFSNFPKGRYYRERFSELLGNGIFNADGASWQDQRRASASEMHSPSYSAYSSGTVHRLVRLKLLPLLSRLSSARATTDLQDVLLRFTFDNICTAAFGVDPGCLSLDLPAVPFATAFEQATELTLLRFIIPPFIWKPMRRFQVGYERRLKAAVSAVHEFAEKTVSDRRVEIDEQGGGSKRSDMLSRLMAAEAVKFSDEFLKDLCISFILAGRDTSSVAMAWFFWLLHKHPRVEEKIMEEVSGVLVRGRSEAEEEEVVFTAEEVRGMDYLQAALSEALRLYPSVPIDFKEAAEDDVLPDGTRVRKGDRVMYSIYSMGRMERIWGKDCREFLPERWMKEGVFAGESQFKYAVFNGGPRLCVGKKFAYMQMKVVAASILLKYRVVPVAEQEVVPKLTTTLYMKNGLLVKFEPRKNRVTLP